MQTRASPLPSNSVTIKDLGLDAQPLCMVGTYGLDIECETNCNPNHKGGPVYETEIKATSDCADKHDVSSNCQSYLRAE